ncbi:transcriptional regulator, AraC family [Marvinbryantia formatexigens DSM 14469]|uniref:Transcriptional regulator, AraC family n=1 Tax=Marvinbryantia formatexigens DSM 14469 TaxID=478749 RepID=C6LGU2_9FIRM|nr:AraC family transcriptional regulator [Marvinbryantia formatexigens]EET60292.1 transcriptional regulator, AraC family [Marvinbryantia formatexigens DSM 14469]UWO24308.1 AraC family transcriptional regulator [Marvinbryantia formatexigens DSM 14469]SDF54954.1 AraC-type DNA-binding protein [Marvinbryantia formatexigens]
MENFQTQLMEHLQLYARRHNGHFTLYTNPEHPDYGHMYLFEQPGSYFLMTGSYTISEDFSLPFHLEKTLLHFGNFHTGAALYQLDGRAPAKSTPCSFLAVEQNLHGIQHWKKGDHYYGIELIVYEDYLKKLGASRLLEADFLSAFRPDYTYRYLPEDVYQILEELIRLIREKRLSPLMLEGKLLECLAHLQQEVYSSENGFLKQLDYGRIRIGKNRSFQLTLPDLRAVHKAHEIIRLNAVNPPTIMQLAAMVGISVQKLKAIFHHQYHITIGAYITSVRMSCAARLLTTTQLSIRDIAWQTGYQQSANFARMFRKTYGQSPGEFRSRANPASELPAGSLPASEDEIGVNTRLPD